MNDASLQSNVPTQAAKFLTEWNGVKCSIHTYIASNCVPYDFAVFADMYVHSLHTYRYNGENIQDQ
jgi:hypothetical protein